MSFTFNTFIMMYLFVDLFAFILLGICLASWMCRLLFCKRTGKFSAISFKHYFFSCLSQFLTHSTCISWYTSSSYFFEVLHFVFLFVLGLHDLYPIWSLLFLSPLNSNLLWTLQKFVPQLLHFSTLIISTWLIFYNFCLLIFPI